MARVERVGLNERWHHYPNQLSGGEQQRVAIARAFATEAKILFADEPTGNLDEETSNQVEALMFELNRENGTTLVIVTHGTMEGPMRQAGEAMQKSASVYGEMVKMRIFD